MVPTESEKVLLFGMMPPIAKMDNTLSTLKAAKHLSLSSNVIEKITGLKGCESCEILSLGRNQIKKLDGVEDVAETLQELWISYNLLPNMKGVEKLPKLRVLIKPSDLRRAIEPHLNACGMASGEMRNLLIDDIENLVFTYANITASSLIDVRLERVNNNACWKFHRDFVDTRLVTTYLGPTTEWVQPAHAAQALREQKRFQGPMEDIALHNVAIFKGNDSSTQSDSGIVHRSPPISGTGYTRLLLCLNEQSPASPDTWSTGHP